GVKSQPALQGQISTGLDSCRRRRCRGWVGAVLAALLLAGCGGPDDDATDASRSLVEAFKEGEHGEACEALTGSGEASLVSEAASKERGGQVSDLRKRGRALKVRKCEPSREQSRCWVGRASLEPV
ncbi:MAG: hypothetical protein WKF96_20635, partial [Solirubrobacteraceae bacterium]